MTPLDRAHILRSLKSIVPAKDCTLLVHSSLKSFGHVEGGAAALVSTLQELCRDGTLVMPTLSFSSFDEENPAFDVAHTKSDTGLVTETFRTTPGVYRSCHPVSSAAAWGKDAKHIAAHHLDTPCGPGSPYRQVIDRDGYVLFLGASMASNTLFHCAEEEVSPAYLRYAKLKHVAVTGPDGVVEHRDFRRYDCTQIGILRYLGKMETVLREKGAVTDYMIGPCHAMMLPARADFDISCAVLRKKPEYILTAPQR